MTAWVWLVAAIVAEVAATVTLTYYSTGGNRQVLIALTAALYVLSYGCLSRGLRAGMDISVAYAVWSGIGTVALALIGAGLFGENLNPVKCAAIALIIAGVTLLHLGGRGTDAHTTAAVSVTATVPAPCTVSASSPSPAMTSYKEVLS